MSNGVLSTTDTNHGTVTNVPNGNFRVWIKIRGNKYILYINETYMTTWTNSAGTYSSGMANLYLP